MKLVVLRMGATALAVLCYVYDGQTNHVNNIYALLNYMEG